MEQLLGKVYAQLPALSGQLTLERVHYDVTRGAAVVSFLCKDLVDEPAFLKIKQVLQQHFPTIRMSLRVASPDLADASKDPSLSTNQISEFR